jgi:hypothetical protein
MPIMASSKTFKLIIMKKNRTNIEFDPNRFRVSSCPCGKSNSDGKFCPYIGYIDKGFCFSCDTTFLPKSKPLSVKRPATDNNASYPDPNFDLIPSPYVKQSFKKYGSNAFVQYLSKQFGNKISREVIKKYRIGTSKYWPGATVFWQTDHAGMVRSGKIMLYNPGTGKRVKEPRNYIYWAHKALKAEGFKLKQCFFGEHLLKVDLFKPVGIVESEKTAIIASVYLPQYTWLAAGSLTNLEPKKCEVLKGRKVVLFPDLNGYEMWNEVAKSLSGICAVRVSTLLHDRASDEERKQGLDLADYLVKFKLEEFKS